MTSARLLTWNAFLLLDTWIKRNSTKAASRKRRGSVEEKGCGTEWSPNRTGSLRILGSEAGQVVLTCRTPAGGSGMARAATGKAWLLWPEQSSSLSHASFHHNYRLQRGGGRNNMMRSWVSQYCTLEQLSSAAPMQASVIPNCCVSAGLQWLPL